MIPLLLTVQNGLHEGWTIRLVNDAYALGRNRDNDLILVDRWISRRHCLFNFVDDRWQLVDLGSTHGVRVNGLAIADPYPLQDGDHIELGEVRLSVVFSPEAAPLRPQQVATVQEHPAVLRIESGPQAGTEIRLNNETYTVGRTRVNDIILRDPTISRRHCLIGISRNEWYIMDLNSRHGVLVNGELVDERQALHGDETVQVGDVQVALRFVFDPMADAGQSLQVIPSPLVLGVLDGLHEGWEIPLVYPSYALGRSRCNDIIMADPSISRVHCLFVFHRGRWAVEDLASSLGVEVNGTVIDGKCVLRGGERLKLGDVTMEVKTGFSRAEEAAEDAAEGPDRRRRTRRKLKIIQTLPMGEFEQTMVIEPGRRPEQPGLDTQERSLSPDMMGRLDETISPEMHAPRPRPRDEHEMMDTVNVELPPGDARQPMPLDNQAYLKTYSMELPPEFRQWQRRFRQQHEDAEDERWADDDQ